MPNVKTINDVRMAVLIDADNVSYHYLSVLMPEVARYGLPTIKRIYGDWTSPNLNGWKPKLQEYAIIPIQQFSYTTGKNSTDSALIIDAMDLLYTETVDAFCLVSSDSDFTRLATRLREAGRKVYGIGEMKTPKPFIAACDKFIYLEVLSADDAAEDEDENAPDKEVEERRSGRNGGRRSSSAARKDDDRPAAAGAPAGHAAQTASVQPAAQQPTAESGPRSRGAAPRVVNMDRVTKRLIVRCIEDVADEAGWAYLGDVGNLLINIRPDFDPRNYGCSKLSQLMQGLHNIDVEFRPGSQPGVKLIYIRNR